MSVKTPQERFYEKLKLQYDVFIETLTYMQPKEIIERASEKMTKQGLLECFAGGNYLTQAEANLLLERNYSLENLYQDWLSNEYSYDGLHGSVIGDIMAESFDERIKKLEAEKLAEYEVKSPVEKLEDKLTTELNDFMENLKGMTVEQVISKAYEIAIKEEFISSFDRDCYDDKKAQLLLDEDFGLNDFYSDWIDYDGGINSMLDDCLSLRIERLEERKEELLADVTGIAITSDNPYSTKTTSTTPLQRFANIDLIDFLGKISEQVIIHHKNDWEIDKRKLLEMTDSPDVKHKQYAWHVSEYGSYLFDSRELFISGTPSFERWVNYRPNEPTMLGYFIEITESKNGTVFGNVFEIGEYSKHARMVRENALPIDSVTLSYYKDYGEYAGSTIVVSKLEFDNDREYLFGKAGDVTNIVYNVENGAQLSEMLRKRQTEQSQYPIGSISEHLQLIADKIVEIYAVPLETTTAKEKVVPISSLPTEVTVTTHTKKISFDEQFKAAEKTANERNAKIDERKQEKEAKHEPKNIETEIGE